MFANFEICRAGLVEAEIKAKRPRSTTGCVECRQRKKKCDEALPICGGCLLRMRGQKANLTCTRSRRQHSPSASSEASSQSSSVTDPNSLTLIPLSTIKASDGEEEFWPLSPQSNARETCRAHFVGDASKWFLPTLSSPINLNYPFAKTFCQSEEKRALRALLDRFDSLTSSTYTSPDLSIMSQGLPLAAEYQSVKAAFVACGLAIIFQVSLSREDRQSAIMHYNAAVNTVASQLMTVPAEANLSAVLLLHIFEEILSDTLVPEWIHMSGARKLVTSFYKNPPSTMHQILLLEAYIYHVVISSIFTGDKSDSLPDDHISELLVLLFESSQRICPGPLWKTSAIIGYSHAAFDYAFRISRLRRRLPLTGQGLEDAMRLRGLLCEAEAELQGTQQHDSSASVDASPPLEMTITASLYIHACILVLEKLLDTSLSASDALPRNTISSAVLLYSQLPRAEQKRPMLTWPSIILGCAAESPHDRAVFSDPFMETIREGGLGSAVQSYRLLGQAWQIDSVLGRPLGLDILLRDDLLCSVFL